MRNTVMDFLATLTPEQLPQAQLPFNSEERLNWHYVPKARQGVCFKEMTPAQKEAALALLRGSVSPKGYEKVATIRTLETVLREIEQGSGPVRDPDLYYVTVFGDPAENAIWGWRFEGHHVSFHWTVVEGQVIASTPQFLGANPAEVRQGPLTGTRVLAAEEDLGRALVKSLDAAQRQEAVLSETAPHDILTAAQRKADILEDRGIPYPRLTAEQQGLLMTLIQEIASVQIPERAEQRLAAVRQAGLDSVKFAWMGGLERGNGHYYRIQGTTFLIEYDCTQNDANHIHVVWRDFEGDFGFDWLERHYQEFPHKKGDGHV